MSFASAGNCSAGGFYSGHSGNCPTTGLSASCQAFIVSKKHGTWGRAKKVPGAAALNGGGDAEIRSVSCGSAGSCSAGGYYTDRSGHSQAFVVSQKHGIWRRARQVPGTAALNTGGTAQITSVSCAPAARCSAVGFYAESSYRTQAFVVSQAR